MMGGNKEGNGGRERKSRVIHILYERGRYVAHNRDV